MDVRKYLHRIDWSGPIAVEADTLARLQHQHLLAVPFENLSIHENEPIVLDDRHLFDKIVDKNRGGFCYEANGLFSSLLRKLGFDAAMVSAQVAKANGTYTPPHDHMAILVNLNGPWLVDVGFGDSFRFPLRISERGSQPETGRDYRIKQLGDAFLVEQNILEQGWEPQYLFTLQSHDYKDFREMCNFHQNSMESHFRKSRVATLATPDGRITLSNMRFITTTLSGSRHERTLESEQECDDVLLSKFGIVVPRT